MDAIGPLTLGVSLPFVVLLPIAYVLGAAVGLLGGAMPGVRLLVLVPALASASLPFLAAPDQPLSRFALALAALLIVFRAIDFIRGATLPSALHRMWFALTPFDVRQASPAPRRLDRRRAGAALAFAVLSGSSYFALREVETAGAAWLARSVLGLAFAYATVGAVVSLVHVGYGLTGWALPDFHREPVLSTTLQEFWGVRWNRPVHEWLGRHLFAPLARRRMPLLGVAAAFVGSAVAHVWLVAVCLPLVPTLAMGAFFLAQGALVLAERRLGVARWSRARGRVWTIACFVVTGPLFCEPVLRVVSF
jgi:hypothetical protein